MPDMNYFNNFKIETPSSDIDLKSLNFGRGMEQSDNRGNIDLMGVSPIDPMSTSSVLGSGTLSLGSSTSTLGSPTAWERFIGNKEVAGQGKIALGALQGIGQFYIGSQQLSFAKKSLKTKKSQFSKQFNIQKQQVNMSIMDKARAMADRSAGSTRKGAVTDAQKYYEENKLRG